MTIIESVNKPPNPAFERTQLSFGCFPWRFVRAAQIPGKPNDDLAPGTLNIILKQAGLKQ